MRSQKAWRSCRFRLLWLLRLRFRLCRVAEWPVHNRSGMIVAAVVSALKEEARALDSFTALTQVSVHVHFDQRTGTVRKVIVRPEVGHGAYEIAEGYNGYAEDGRT